MAEIVKLTDLPGMVGRELEASDWLEISQERVNYLAPVCVGKRIRSRSKILDVLEKRPNEWLIKTNVTIEIEDEETPALIAEILGLYHVS